MDADVIVVGAGSAGCVVAARLSQDAGRRVLLVEAGPDHRADALPEELRLLSRPVRPPYNWGDQVTSTGGRTLNYARGRVVGGSSATNGAVAMRAEPADFDSWPAELGWDAMLSHLVRVEHDLDFPDRPYHGDSGPIPVLRWPRQSWSPLQQGFVTGAQEAGLGYCADHSEPGSTGVGPIPMNRRESARVSNAIAYLEPARGRANLTVLADAHVLRLLVDSAHGTSPRVQGVELADGRQLRAGEVVLAAGVVQNPLLFTRSGLQLPHVGKHLTDHLVVSHIADVHPDAVPDGGPTLQTIARATAPDSDRTHDLQLTPVARRGENGARALETSVSLQLPDGEGEVRASGPGVDDPAVITWPFAAIAENVRRLREGWRLAARIAEASGLACDQAQLDADLSAGDEHINQLVATRHYAFYHGVGTCRFGQDAGEGVVAPDFTVHGVSGLRVVDASVIPTVPRANTHLLVTALAEAAAERIAAH